MRRIFGPLFAALLVLQIASPPASAEPANCPDELSYTGRIVNRQFGFAFAVPEGLTAYWSGTHCTHTRDGCTCRGDHGRIIPLGGHNQKEERDIDMYADLRSDDEDRSAASNAPDMPNALPGSTQVISSRRVRVGGVAATRTVFRFQDETSKRWKIRDTVKLVHNDLAYEFTLREFEGNYATDRPVFEHVLATVLFSDPYQ